MFDPDASSSDSSRNRDSKKGSKIPDDDPLYRQKREKNNEAVKKSREKKRRESEETSRSIEHLQAENNLLRHREIQAEASWRTTKEIYENICGKLSAAEEAALFRKEQ
jgi:hypothetical protein